MMTEMRDQRSYSAAYVKVLTMNFPLSVSPSKDMGDHTGQTKNSDLRGNRTHNLWI